MTISAGRQAQRSLDEDIGLARRADAPLGQHPGHVSLSREWTRTAQSVEPRLLTDLAWPRLLQQLHRLEQTGVDAGALLREALAQRPLPDELPASALLSRLPDPAGHEADAPHGPAAQATAAPAPVKPSARWHQLGHRVDPRLVTGPDWTGLAGAMERAHRSGYDLETHLPRLAAQEPLPDERPARTLQYRLVEHCPASQLTIPDHVQHQLTRELVEQARDRLRASDRVPAGGRCPGQGPAAAGPRR